MAQADPAPVPALAGTSPDTSTLRRRKPVADNSKDPLGVAQAAPELEKGHTEKDEAPLGKTPDGTGPSWVPYLVPESACLGGSNPRLTLTLGSPYQCHAVFKIPQTHNMLTSLFDPRTPKSVRPPLLLPPLALRQRLPASPSHRLMALETRATQARQKNNN